MLTSKITKQVAIPHEEGEWFRFRMLSGKQLEAARGAKTAAVLGNFRQMGGEVLRELQNGNREQAEAVIQADPLAEYDIDTLLRFGVVGWSYQERLCPAALEDLDERTRKWAATELLKLHDESQEAVKNA